MPPVPKPEPRAKMKRRTWVSKASKCRKGAEAVVIQRVRQQVERRDGACRAATWGLGPCRGPQQWAHVGPWKRYATRGRAAEERHCTRGSMMLCDCHHDAYDANEWAVEPMDGEQWADGRLRVVRADVFVLHEESEGPYA